MKKVDINVDIAEGFPYDEELLKFATSANICCGEHAGDRDLTLRTIDLCNRKSARIGCHPGFPDRASFGRRIPNETEIEQYCASILGQAQDFGALSNFAYIKPHGAWYSVLNTPVGELMLANSTIYDYCMRTLAELSGKYGAPVMLQSVSLFYERSLRRIYRVINEGFADRRYRKDGSLVPRSEHNALLEDPSEIKAQVVRLARKVDSICVHGDTPDCVRIAELVRKTLTDAGYEVGY